VASGVEDDHAKKESAAAEAKPANISPTKVLAKRDMYFLPRQKRKPNANPKHEARNYRDLLF
jgi:hypothetical protein